MSTREEEAMVSSDREREEEETEKKKTPRQKRKPMSEETKRKIAAAKKGKQQTEETRQKISDAMKRRTLSVGHRFHIAESKRGKCHSPETREKISRAVSSTKTMLKKQRLAERAASVAAAATADLRPAFKDSTMQEDEDELILDMIELEKAVIEVTLLRDQLTMWMEAYENKYGRKPDLTETSESHPHVYGRFVSQAEVASFLEDIGLGHLAPKFKDNGVNGKDLLELEDEDYRESLGCSNLQIKKIKRELESRSSGAVTKPSATVEQETKTPPIDDLSALREKLVTAESAAEKYSGATALLESACKKMQSAAGALTITQASGGLEMMQDIRRPGRGRGFRGRRGDFGHTMIEMGTVRKAQGALKEAGADIQRAMQLVPTIPHIKPATVQGAMSGVVLNALLMPGIAGDMMQQAKVKRAKDEITTMANECRQAQEWCKKSHMAAHTEATEVKTTLRLKEMNV
eukprot:jgi/Picre1/32555/NNA_007901.t1